MQAVIGLDLCKTVGIAFFWKQAWADYSHEPGFTELDLGASEESRREHVRNGTPCTMCSGSHELLRSSGARMVFGRLGPRSTSRTGSPWHDQQEAFFPALGHSHVRANSQLPAC